MNSLQAYITESITSLHEWYNYTISTTTPHKNLTDQDWVRFNCSKKDAVDLYVKTMEEFGIVNDQTKPYITELANIWVNIFNCEPSCVPLRININNLKKVKLARIYFDNGYVKFKQRKLGGITFKHGDGLGGGIAGMKHERTIYNLICSYITDVSDKSKFDEKSFFENVKCDSPMAKQGFISIMKTPELFKIISSIESIEDVTNPSPSKLGFLSIYEQTKINKTIDNGQYIRDIILNAHSTQPVYLSIKMKDAQVSQPYIDSRFRFENEQCDDEAENFWSWFGIDVKKVMKFYSDHKPGKYDTEDIDISCAQTDPNKAGLFIQNVMGWNYWYCKPDEVKLITPSTIKRYSYIVERVVFANYRRIVIYGKLGNIPCRIALRTKSKQHLYPRIFSPEFDTYKYIN